MGKLLGALCLSTIRDSCETNIEPLIFVHLDAKMSWPIRHEVSFQAIHLQQLSSVERRQLLAFFARSLCVPRSVSDATAWERGEASVPLQNSAIRYIERCTKQGGCAQRERLQNSS